MPGPDGIPYQAWKRLGILAVDTLTEALQALGHGSVEEKLGDETGSATGAHAFNAGTMVFLPKKVAGLDPTHGDFYTAADVRPLVIVNTDNRLLASAMRHRVEPIFSKWVVEEQRGFLHGRSMLANVVDVEHEAMRIALSADNGGILLFDFRAAFPSLAHQCLHGVLRRLRLPGSFLAFIKKPLYPQFLCPFLRGQLARGVRDQSGRPSRLSLVAVVIRSGVYGTAAQAQAPCPKCALESLRRRHSHGHKFGNTGNSNHCAHL